MHGHPELQFGKFQRCRIRLVARHGSFGGSAATPRKITSATLPPGLPAKSLRIPVEVPALEVLDAPRPVLGHLELR